MPSYPQSKSRWSMLTSTLSFIKLVKSALRILPSKSQTLATQLSSPANIDHPPRNYISRPRNLKKLHPLDHSNRPNHPICRLPFEIISLIFVLGSEQDSFFPVTVSHVCSKWRQISLRTPELWRNIDLGPEESMWHERLHRSKACSLDVQLLSSRITKSGFRRSQDLDPYSVHWYMQIVLPHIRRWRSLEIEIAQYSPCIWKAALAGCSAPSPLLEELSLTFRLNDDTKEFLLFSAFAPRLSRLKVDGIRLAWMSSLFANLTFLDYTHHGFTSGHQAVNDIIAVLAVTSRLTELHVLFPRGRIACLPCRHNIVTQRAILPRLKQLVLKVDGSDIPFELAHLATLISSPVLSILRLVDLRRARQSFPSLKSFFYVYSLPPTIRVISLGHAWYDPRMIHAMVHSLPYLYQILIKRSSIPEKVLDFESQGHRVIRPMAVNRPMAKAKVQERGGSHRHYRVEHSIVDHPQTSDKNQRMSS